MGIFEIGGVSLLVAFLAGLLSIASPCVLPLVPAYLGYLTGASLEGPAPGRQPRELVAETVVSGATTTSSASVVSGNCRRSCMR